MMKCGDVVQLSFGKGAVVVAAGAVISQETVQHFLWPVTLRALHVLLAVPVGDSCYGNDGFNPSTPVVATANGMVPA